MGVGLEIFDDAGGVVLDASTLVGRVLGTFDTGTVNGSFQNAALTGGLPFYFANLNATALMQCIPEITISGTTVSWVFRDYAISGGNAPRVSSTVVYGYT